MHVGNHNLFSNIQPEKTSTVQRQGGGIPELCYLPQECGVFLTVAPVSVQAGNPATSAEICFLPCFGLGGFAVVLLSTFCAEALWTEKMQGNHPRHMACFLHLKELQFPLWSFTRFHIVFWAKSPCKCEQEAKQFPGCDCLVLLRASDLLLIATCSCVITWSLFLWTSTAGCGLRCPDPMLFFILS